MMGVILALFALSCALSTVSDAAAYSDMKRQQKDHWDKMREHIKENYERMAKEKDFYWRASEDPYGMIAPDRSRHYDGTPR